MGFPGVWAIVFVFTGGITDSLMQPLMGEIGWKTKIFSAVTA